MRQSLRIRGEAFVPAQPKVAKEVRQVASRKAALAVLGCRFAGGVKEALKHPDFHPLATRYYTDEYLREFGSNPEIVSAAKAAEDQRLAEEEALAAAERAGSRDLQRSSDPEYGDRWLRVGYVQARQLVLQAVALPIGAAAV